MPPRRKRRSAEVRNSLRLFGLLAVLAGVNVYVFFFNRGTAPREVLKPSSTFKAADGASGKTATLKQAAADAQNQLQGQLQGQQQGPSAGAGPQSDSLEVPGATTRHAAAVKAKPPVPVAPVSSKTATAKPTSVASGGSPPKGSPGGSPGQDDGTPPPQAQSNSAPVTAPGNLENSPEANQEKTFGESDTLGQVLAREGFDDDAPKVVAALSRLLDPKLIRGGQHYAVRLDEQGDPEGFEYHPTPVTRYVATRGPSGAWVGARVDQAPETRVVSASGTIDATLYESIQRAGETGALVGLLVDLLAWDVNFYTDTHPGDHWKVIVEKQYLGGQFYRYGRLLAAEYGGRVGNFRAFYWTGNRANADGPGQGRYYDEKGQAISKTLLKTPLRFVRISSKFDRHRLHPILHREKAHLGIDYAAPTGTPVWASSGGKVVECAMKRGSGNTVVLSHGNGMATRYYHLSRFARGLRAGKTVRQKELIGFVGTTGLSTGPHLHFSVTKNGAFVDPNKVQINRDAPVDNRPAFLAAVKPRLVTLQGLDPRTIARN